MRNFYIIWLGQLISIFGSSLGAFAVGVWVYEQTGSVTRFALIAFFAVLPSIVLSPVVGVLADRWNRRMLMMVANLGALVGPLLILYLASIERLAIPLIYLVIIWITTCATLLGPAFASSVPLLVPKSELGRASGMASLGPAMARIVAPFAAGFLVLKIGLVGVMWIDVFSFAFAALSLLFVQIPQPKKKAQAAGPSAGPGAAAEEDDGVAAGWTFLKKTRGLLHLLFIFAGFNLVLGMVQVLLAPMVLSPSFAKGSGLDNVMVLGIIQTVGGIGTLIGGTWVSLWGGPQRRVPAIFALLVIQGLMIGAAGIKPQILPVALSAFVFMLFVPLVQAFNQVLWQVKTPPRVQGRVFALRDAIALSTTPIAYLVAGPLADHVFGPLLEEGGRLAETLGPIYGLGNGRGMGLMLSVVGVMIVGMSAVAFFSPRLRRLEDEIPDAVTETTAEEAQAEAAAAAAAKSPALEIEEHQASAGGGVEAVVRDVRYSVRSLLRRPGYAMIVVLTLALGLGATAAIFSVTTSVLLERLPFKEPQRLVMLNTLRTKDGFQLMPMSFPDYRDWREQRGEIFTEIAVYGAQSFNLLVGNEAQHVAGEMASASYWDVLGIDPVTGRTFTEDEDRMGGAVQVAVISYSLWQSTFDGDPGIVGREVKLSGRGYEIVGVTPPGFQGMSDQAQVWVPLQMAPLLRNPDFIDLRRFRWMSGVGRLQTEVGLAEARAAMDIVSGQMARTHPETNRDVLLGIRMLQDVWFSTLQTMLISLSAGAVFVLLIATINVAAILLGRALARGREMSMRKALGASTWQLTRQLIAESSVLSVCGLLAGLVIAWWTLRALVATNAVQFRSFIDIGLNPATLILVVCLTLVASMVFGLAPAWVASRSELVSAMKEGSQGAGGGRLRSRLQALLVIGEVALALALLVGAGLGIRAFQSAQEVDFGYEQEDLVTLRLNVKDPRYESPEALASLVRDLGERLDSLPGIGEVAFSSPTIPTDPWLLRDITLEDFSGSADDNKILIEAHHVSPGYFDALGVRVRQGRLLDPRDTRDSAPAVVISEKLADRYWPGEDPIGKGIRFFTAEAEEPWFRVVGVVPDLKYRGYIPDNLGAPHVYFSLLQEPPRPTSMINILAKVEGGSVASATGAVRSELRARVPDLPPYDVKPLAQRLEDQLASSRVLVSLGAAFALLALALAAVGIYGIVSYSVAQQRRDIAVRMAIGAQRRNVLGQILFSSTGLALAGIASGAILALMLTWFMDRGNLLGDVSAQDPVTFLSTAVVLLMVAIIASLVPAWRATQVNPNSELRGE